MLLENAMQAQNDPDAAAAEGEADLEALLKTQMENSSESDLSSMGDSFLAALGEQEMELKKKTSAVSNALKDPSKPENLLNVSIEMHKMQAQIEFTTVLASKGVNMIDSLTKMN